MKIKNKNVRLKSVLLPVEHGGWGFLSEPILLGLLVTPSLSAVYLSVATIAAFLLRHPLKLYLKARKQGELSPKGTAAKYVTLFYAMIAFVGFMVILFTVGIKPLLPFVILSPFMIIYLIYDNTSRGRNMLPELTGPLGLAAVAPAIVLANDWTTTQAAVLWFILLSRFIPSILYVRTRLRLERGETINRLSSFLSHLFCLLVLLFFTVFGFSPFSAVIAMAILYLRAVIGLSPKRRPAKVKTIGYLELGYGLVYVLGVGLGYIFSS